jgi:putative ABC transport system ATP-binding protein
VAIARALANQPTVILADEPTGNLDSRTGKEIMSGLEGLVDEGRLLVMVTHDEALARRAHRTVRLADGRIVR